MKIKLKLTSSDFLALRKLFFIQNLVSELFIKTPPLCCFPPSLSDHPLIKYVNCYDHQLVAHFVYLQCGAVSVVCTMFIAAFKLKTGAAYVELRQTEI